MIKPVHGYFANCDACGQSPALFDERFFPAPQDVTETLVGTFKWTVFEDIHFCFYCPPLCGTCGHDDLDCLCAGGPHGLLGSDHAAYVSREPNVIVTEAGDGQS